MWESKTWDWLSWMAGLRISWVLQSSRQLGLHPSEDWPGLVHQLPQSMTWLAGGLSSLLSGEGRGRPQSISFPHNYGSWIEPRLSIKWRSISTSLSRFIVKCRTTRIPQQYLRKDKSKKPFFVVVFFFPPPFTFLYSDTTEPLLWLVMI